MKKLFFILLLAFTLPQIGIAQYVYSQGNPDPCCIEFEIVVLSDGWEDLWTVTVDGVAYTSANTTNVGNTFTWEHCFPGNGTYDITHCAIGWGECDEYTAEITDCESDCWTEEIGTDECPVGSYTLCCDGSLSVNALPSATYVKIYNVSNCAAMGGVTQSNACILCSLWTPPGVCNGQTWNFPAGTVTASNSIWLEFQSSGPPHHEIGCDFFSGLLNLSDEISENCEGEDRSGSTKVTKLSTAVEIYPNPANDLIYINSNSEVAQEVQIFNTNGQQLLTKIIAGDYTRMDVSQLSKGFYLINIKNTETGSIHSEKLIILK